jgi:hypothetical protein
VVARPVVRANAPIVLSSASLAPILLLATRDGEGEDLAVKQRARSIVAAQPDALLIRG